MTIGKNKPYEERRKYPYNGEWYTVVELSEFSPKGVDAWVIWERLNKPRKKKVWTVEQAVETPLRRGKKEDLNGFEYTHRELADMFDNDVTRQVLSSRIVRGWDIWEAAKTPRYVKPGRG